MNLSNKPIRNRPTRRRAARRKYLVVATSLNVLDKFKNIATALTKKVADFLQIVYSKLIECNGKSKTIFLVTVAQSPRPAGRRRTRPIGEPITKQLVRGIVVTSDHPSRGTLCQGALFSQYGGPFDFPNS